MTLGRLDETIVRQQSHHAFDMAKGGTFRYQTILNVAGFVYGNLTQEFDIIQYLFSRQTYSPLASLNHMTTTKEHEL